MELTLRMPTTCDVSRNCTCRPVPYLTSEEELAIGCRGDQEAKGKAHLESDTLPFLR